MIKCFFLSNEEIDKNAKVNNTEWWVQSPEPWVQSPEPWYRPDKININLEKYYSVGKEIVVDRYGVYRVDKVENGILHLSAIKTGYNNNSQIYNFIASYETGLVKDLLDKERCDTDGSKDM